MLVLISIVLLSIVRVKKLGLTFKVSKLSLNAVQHVACYH